MFYHGGKAANSDCAGPALGLVPPGVLVGALLSVSLAVFYLFPHERYEWSFALVGAGVFAFLELSRPSKTDARLAKKTALLADSSDETASEPVKEEDAPAETISNSTSDDALLEAIGDLDMNAQEFVVLAQRWAEGSGLTSTSPTDGKLPALAWQILATYFLQVSEQGSSKLPGFDAITGATSCNPEWEAQEKSVAELFREFIAFYTSDFDWQGEAACVKTAQRGQPRAGFIQSSLANDDGFTSLLCPGIEDPFQPGNNLGNLLDADNYERIQQELTHTDMMNKCMDMQ